jgi:hypothetical protein
MYLYKLFFMTVINGIEIDCIHYETNPIRDAIKNNEPLENKLHVIAVISNPCLYGKRYKLINEFITRIELEETDVLLYVVEIAYKNQKFVVTNPNNKRHLQIRTETPLWHKENMINLAVKHLLPKKWKAMAWIDSDLEFESNSWALDTLKILNGTKDVVQLFSHCDDMDKNGLAMRTFTSFGYQYTKKNKYSGAGPNFWHPGYAWACTRKAYEKMGGLYDLAVLGSGDNVMAMAYIQNVLKSANQRYTESYLNSILEFQDRVKGLRIGYVPGVIRHHYHGSKINRKYTERWEILINHKYDPLLHVKKTKEGVLIPTENCPTAFLDDIMHYFEDRKEDD